MLKGDCNECIWRNMPEDSEVCVDCGIARKNFRARKKCVKYIRLDDALDFELDVEADSVEELQAIMKGMALYADYLKSLPVFKLPEDTDSSKATERVVY